VVGRRESATLILLKEDIMGFLTPTNKQRWKQHSLRERVTVCCFVIFIVIPYLAYMHIKEWIYFDILRKEN